MNQVWFFFPKSAQIGFAFRIRFFLTMAHSVKSLLYIQITLLCFLTTAETVFRITDVEYCHPAVTPIVHCSEKVTS